MGALLHSTAPEQREAQAVHNLPATGKDVAAQSGAVDQISTPSVDQHGMSTLLTEAHVVQEAPTKSSPAHKSRGSGLRTQSWGSGIRRLKAGKLLITTRLCEAQRSQWTSAHQVSNAPCTAKKATLKLSREWCGQTGKECNELKGRSVIGSAA